MDSFLGLVGPYVRMEYAKEVLFKDFPPLFQSVDEQILEIAPSIGFEVDKVRFLSCMFMSFPLAIIHTFLPNSPTLKHIYTAGIGLLMGFFRYFLN